MIYGLLLTLFIFLSFLLIALILIQQTKGSIGIGSMGGSTQMLFGGSGGQTIFQKATWFLGFTFMGLSLGLALLKSSGYQSKYLRKNQQTEQADTTTTTQQTENSEMVNETEDNA